MQPNNALKGKKVLIISQDMDVLQKIKQTIQSHGGACFPYSDTKLGIANIMTKKPDLVVCDERAQSWNEISPLSYIRRAQPKGRLLLLTHHAVPQHAIDISARGISYSVPYGAQIEEIYNALKHSLSISSVPRVESNTR
jgi:DNA-binding NtrC family response regulator